MDKGYRKRLERMYGGDSGEAMEDERHEMMRISALLKSTAADDAERGVKPFLADRIMNRVAAGRRAHTPEEELWAGLVWIFRPVAAACVLLSLALAVHNVYLSRQYATPVSAVEAVLALPDVNTVAAYELDLAEYEEAPE